MSVAGLIRKTVDGMMSHIKTGERRKRALEMAGGYSSGKYDISMEHDKYLADAVGML